MCTHESYLHRVVALAKARASEADRQAIEGIKLVYGTGPAGTRGVTYYQRWQNGHPEPVPLVEICAGAESWVQLAGTVLHELGHVVAGWGTGHGPEWRAACERLGLRRARAAGHRYLLAGFDPEVRLALATGPRPSDGAPLPVLTRGRGAPNPKPCGAGYGIRGGKSRGPGSGSRLVKCVCTTCGYLARTTRKWIEIGPPHCPIHGAMKVQ